MLVITRKTGQTFRIELAPGVDPSTPVRDIFPEPIRITVAAVHHSYVRLGIAAHPSLVILREELETDPIAPPTKP